MIRVTVNGEPRQLEAEATVASVIASQPGVPASGRGVAVAVAGEVIPRSAWADTQLREGAQVELVVAVQGG